MKKTILMLVVCVSFTCGLTSTHSVVLARPNTSTVKPTPSYAKWGELAVEAAEKKYPNASVVDYKHFQRTDLSPTEAQETFKLWMKDANHEFGLYVYILFNKANNKLSRISFKETTR